MAKDDPTYAQYGGPQKRDHRLCYSATHERG